MKKLLTTFFLAVLCSASAMADPIWREKPVQCAPIQEIYDYYVTPNKLKPMFIAVAKAATEELEAFTVPIAFYLGEDGKWLLVELGGDEYSCVISLGDGWDPNVDEYELNNLILNGNNT